jgi:phage tail sheath protein FI
MLNFCQARRDVVCIFTLPQHFEKRHCVEWQENFRQRLGLEARRSSFDDSSRQISDLSYAAVFHPWLLQPEPTSPDGLRRVACDGAVCGMIAARERARQVWVAPANVPLQSVLGLTPVLNNDDWADLFDLHFNLVRAEPHDFRLMSAHTLSDEAILLQISVRRLLILLRKVAVERGMDFVFESNHERFREAVRLMLEKILRFMFERGAFAGATPEQSYRVITDKSVNTRESVDAGRFIAQIQVAPSQPMEFITVLLTRIGEDLLQMSEA